MKFFKVYYSINGRDGYKRLNVPLVLIILVVLILLSSLSIYFLTTTSKLETKKELLAIYQNENKVTDSLLNIVDNESKRLNVEIDELTKNQTYQRGLYFYGMDFNTIVKPDTNIENKTFSLPFLDSYTDTVLTFLRTIALKSEGKNSIWLKIPVLSPLKSKTAVIVRPFGRSRDPLTGIDTTNNGIDYFDKLGTPVYATANGRVTRAYKDNYWGYRVVVNHGNNITTSYSHLKGLNVSTNKKVYKGDIIGYIGKSGWVAQPSLHYEITKNGKYIDPQILINVSKI